MFGFLILLLPALQQGIVIKHYAVFWGGCAVTALVTAVATVYQIRTIQKNPIAGSVPYLTFIPVFMIPWTWLLYRELPRPWAAAGIVLSVVGGYLLNSRTGAHPWQVVHMVVREPASRTMLLVALALGLTTALDKAIIGSSSGITYAFIWSGISIPVMLLFTPNKSFKQIFSLCSNRHLFIQALLWSAGFTLQMVAVQHAANLHSGVTYVKALSLSSTLFSVLFGGLFLREGGLIRNSAAAFIMVCGAVLVVL
jgi:drug/metabolite transporter (DMT)-like permease